MSNYFDKFPKTIYNLDNTESQKNFTFMTNIFVRLSIIQETLNNIYTYYDYIIPDGETPEIVAEKYYGDPEAYWIILLTNKLLDPIYDWPLSQQNFNSYIISKYGSTANAQSAIHTYNHVVKTIEHSTDTTKIIKIPFVSEDEYNDSLLPTDEGSGITYSVNSKAVTIYEYKTTISVYDHEEEINEKKRSIKLIKKIYYSNIKETFDTILRQANPDKQFRTFIRRF